MFPLQLTHTIYNDIINGQSILKICHKAAAWRLALSGRQVNNLQAASQLRYGLILQPIKIRIVGRFLKFINTNFTKNYKYEDKQKRVI